MNNLIGITIPFIGTILGASSVFLMKKEMNQLVNKALLGFASGVMIAASVWSLIIPSIDMSVDMGKFAFLPAAIGVLITIAGALALSIGIAIQNFPEGAIISMPLRSEGVSKSKSFFYGLLSGVVEPIGAILMILFSATFTPIMPYLLSFAAGAMIYVVVEELIPEASKGEHSNISTIGFAMGFVIMMILDVALS